MPCVRTSVFFHLCANKTFKDKCFQDKGILNIEKENSVTVSMTLFEHSNDSITKSERNDYIGFRILSILLINPAS